MAAGEGRRRVAFLLLGLGIALLIVAIAAAQRPTAQRVLYTAAGVMFIVAAFLHLKTTGGWLKGSGDKKDGSPQSREQ